MGIMGAILAILGAIVLATILVSGVKAIEKWLENKKLTNNTQSKTINDGDK